jgi:hypothetical protein
VCEPTTIAGVAVAGGALINAYGQVQAGKANQQIANNNARLAEYQASDSLRAGAQEAGAIQAEGRQAAASARVAAGASGIDANVGSAANAQTTSLINSEADAARTTANAAREAWGYKQQARDLRVQGKQARKAGILGAIGSSLSAGGAILGRSG